MELKTINDCESWHTRLNNAVPNIWQFEVCSVRCSDQGRLSLSTDGDKCAMVNFGGNEQKVT